jgi:hypothetical protein
MAFGPRLEPIVPAPFDAKAFDRKLTRALLDVTKLIERDYASTVATWDEKPEFKTKFTINDKEMSAFVHTTDNVYRFLHDGTSVRYAIMSKSFRPKTRVNRLTSEQGRGGRTHIDVHHPQPGIQARNWTTRIIKIREKKIIKILRNAITGAVRESNHAR